MLNLKVIVQKKIKELYLNKYWLLKCNINDLFFRKVMKN